MRVRILCLLAALAVAFVVVPATPAAAAEGPDVAVTLTDAGDPVEAGDEATYTATVANEGTQPATDVRFTWSLSAGLALRAVVMDGVACGNPAGGVNFCAIGALAPAASKTISIHAVANPAEPGSVSATGSVTLTEADPVDANNTATQQTGVVAPAAGAWKRQAVNAWSPSARLGAAAAYDEARKRVVLVGGAAGTVEPAPMADTSLWNGTTWEQAAFTGLTGARAFAQMAYNPADQTVVLFGGLGNFDVLADTWVWNGSTWTQKSPPFPTPPARAMGGMTYAAGKIVLFGGIDTNGEALGDTWTWDGSKWTKVASTGPSPRNGFAFATDRHSGHAVLFGGCCTATDDYFGETWVWNGSSWAKKSPAASPAAREGAAATWNVATASVVLFGGLDNSVSDRNDVWSWDGGNWTQIPTTRAPAARDGAVLAFSPQTGVAPGRLVLFGGWDDDGEFLGDTQSLGLAPRARLAVSPATMSFGGEIVGLTKRAQLAISNSGAGEGTIGTPAISGVNASDFAVANNACASAPLGTNGRCTIEVAFSPRAAGARSASLTVPTSDGTFVVKLSGLGYVISGRTPGTVSNTSVNATFPVSWGPLQNVTGYDVEWTERFRTSSGAYVAGSWRRWKTATTATGAWFGGSGQPPSVPGHTYLFRVRGHTASGTGPWGPTTSAIVPVDDRSSWLGWSGSWSDVSAGGRYFSTIRQTTTASTMTLVTDTNMFQLIGERCTTCGQFKVYIDNVYVATMDTRAATTHQRQVLYSRYLPGGIKRHTLKIVTMRTAGRPTVKIDGVALAR